MTGTYVTSALISSPVPEHDNTGGPGMYILVAHAPIVIQILMNETTRQKMLNRTMHETMHAGASSTARTRSSIPTSQDVQNDPNLSTEPRLLIINLKTTVLVSTDNGAHIDGFSIIRCT